MALKDALVALERVGLTDVILPFILVFTVVFAVLQRSKVLGTDRAGKPRANYNAMVAFVLAFFVLILVQTLQVIAWFTRFVALLLVAFVFLGVLFALLGVRERHRNIAMFLALVLLSAALAEVLAWTGVIDPGIVARFVLPVLVVIGIAGLLRIFLGKKTAQAEATVAEKQEPPGLEKEKEIGKSH